MIISASYKTDILTFYGEWFMNRLRAGYCKMVNPYGRQIYTIGLLPANEGELQIASEQKKLYDELEAKQKEKTGKGLEKVEGIVFWTKNIGPFLKHLPEVQARGFPFIVQHTINGYPRELEARVINYEHTIEHARYLADKYGPERLVWRYDPLIFSSLTDYDWHLRNFEKLSAALEGNTDEVVISFVQPYVKTKRNMSKVDEGSEDHSFSWETHEAEEVLHGLQLASELAQIADTHGMQVKICSQKRFLQAHGVVEARCIDADRLERLPGCSIGKKDKQKGNRKECGCFASKDIGEYDTCPHGCVYCYAVRNRELALTRYREHDPLGEFLSAPKGYVPEEDTPPQEDTTSHLITVTKSSKRRKGSKGSARGKNVAEQLLSPWSNEG